MGPRNNGGGGTAGIGFKAMGLSEEVFKGICRMGFSNPTPVQRKALPIVLSGIDTVVMARTGSGKTAAFLIPLLEALLNNGTSADNTYNSTAYKGVRAIVLSPTRELSLQTLRVLQKMSHFTTLRSVGIHGGESMEKQFELLSSKPDVIVATPGRLSHHLSEIPDFSLKECRICILDEADRLLEMGFAMQLRQIGRSIDKELCQKVLLSATIPKVLVEFTKSGFMEDHPHVVRLDQDANVSPDMRLTFLTCRSLEKDAALLQVLEAIQQDSQAHQELETEGKSSSGIRTGLTLIFCATRHHVEYVAAFLRASGLETAMIYGTLDHDARKANLSAFRQGRKPILVTTDVAARGVDIPLLDHVLHYHFPPSPKLFIHRSGRVARAGRIGYCWALVDPEELPYMVDLHLFLGRKVIAANTTSTTVESETNTVAPEHSDDKSSSNSTAVVTPYELDDMTPDMVHFGSIPEAMLHVQLEHARRINDAVGSDHAETLRALSRTCWNAMKQYRKSRPEASGEATRRAKAILEGDKNTGTGQRIGLTTIPPHPLFQKYVEKQYERDEQQGKIGALNHMDNVMKRDEFLRAVACFRPKETVFEAFATGRTKEAGIHSQVDKGRTTKQSTKNTSTVASFTAMKSMRRQMRLARDKGSSLVVAGTTDQPIVNGDEEPLEKTDDITTPQTQQIASTATLPHISSKKRVSKAERKRMKRQRNMGKTPPGADNALPFAKRTKETKRDFRDPTFFMDDSFSEQNHEELSRQRRVEAALQPSAASSSMIKGAIGNAMRLEESMLDMVGDENDDMVKNQRMTRWDKSKKKYVQTTVGIMLSGASHSKKIKLESGQFVNSDKVKLGELYQKWQKKTNRSIGRDGVFDSNNPVDPSTSGVMVATPAQGKGKHQAGMNKNEKNNKKDDEMKSAQVILEERRKKEDSKLKNMKRTDRKKIERQKDQGDVAPKSKKKGYQGKKGASGRWKKNK